MPPKIKKPEMKNLPRWPFITAGIILALLLIIFGSLFSYQKVYAEKFYRGISLAGIDLGGMTLEQAKVMLESKISEINRSGFLFSYKDRQTVISPHVTSTADPDIAYDIVEFNVDRSLNSAFAVGHKGGYWQKTSEQITSLLGGKNFDAYYQLSENKLLDALKENFSSLENPGGDAELIITKTDTGYDKKIKPESTGESFDYDSAIVQLENHLRNLTTAPIELNLIPDVPKIKSTAAETTLPLIDEILAKDDLVLNFEDNSWTIKDGDLINLLDFDLDKENKIRIDVSLEKLEKYLENNIGPEVNRPALDAKFSMVNGRVTEFQGSQEGRKIVTEGLLTNINNYLTDGGGNNIIITVATTKPLVLTNEVNNMGIEDIIGVGLSNFAGSPANRRHNIKVGADSLNGLIVKPGDEFSLLDALGEIDGEHGYLQELVIKGNKTTPEYGGGLCQIGTTTFRAAISSGLPITARRNHSYRVSYYEPAGTDATIYDPAPDFRFLNDTGHNVLIQTKILGDQLRFEFWGTPDGRKTYFIGDKESSDLYDIKPKVWNLVYPAPTKYVESVDIPVGSKRCTEGSHVGATTEFTYQVTYPDGEEKEQVFTSVYKPWQAVCLIGVEKLSTPEEETTCAEGDTECTTQQTDQSNTDTATTPAETTAPTEG